MHEPPPPPMSLEVVAWVRSSLRSLGEAPKQGDEGAQEAVIEFEPRFAAAADLRAGEDVLLLTWLDRADRSVQAVHPRDDHARPLTGVFGTRSPDRPNPIGLHRVSVVELVAGGIRVSGLEALDGTPVVDVKPVLGDER